MSDELDRLRKVEQIAWDLLEECKGDIPPSLGTMAKLADAVLAVRKWRSRAYSRDCIARDIPGATCQHPHCGC